MRVRQRLFQQSRGCNSKINEVSNSFEISTMSRLSTNFMKILSKQIFGDFRFFSFKICSAELLVFV